jgi:uncharacterized protein
VKRRERDKPDTTAFDDLAALYAEIDARLADHACPSTTECCRFGITGREPYVTGVELAYLQKAIGKAGGKTPLERNKGAKRLPVAGLRDERTCPLLAADARCAAYAARPLGCRTFFCERATADQPLSQQETNAFVRRVKEIAAAERPGGDQGRPLTRALGLG